MNNQQKDGLSAPAQDFSFLKEGSPIYVTSLSGSNVTSGSITHTTDSGAHSNPTPVIANNYHHKPQQANNNPSSSTNAPNPYLASTSSTTQQSNQYQNHQQNQSNNHYPLTAASSTLSSASSAGSGSVILSNYPSSSINPTPNSYPAKTTTTPIGGAHPQKAASASTPTNNNNNQASCGQPQTSFDTFYGGHSAKTATVATATDITPSIGSVEQHQNGHTAKREVRQRVESFQTLYFIVSFCFFFISDFVDLFCVLYIRVPPKFHILLFTHKVPYI